jgi:hypothetical protein
MHRVNTLLSHFSESPEEWVTHPAVALGAHNGVFLYLQAGQSSGDVAPRRKPGNPDVEPIRAYIWGSGLVLGHV